VQKTCNPYRKERLDALTGHEIALREVRQAAIVWPMRGEGKGKRGRSMRNTHVARKQPNTGTRTLTTTTHLDENGLFVACAPLPPK